MLAVFEKEIKLYFSSMTGYVFIGVLLLLSGIMCLAGNLFYGDPAFESTLSMVSYIFLLIVPILTMSVVADERRNKTDQLLFSLPLGMGSIIMGKYLALLAVFAVPTGIMCLCPLILSLYGTVNFLTSYSAIFGFYILGAALLAFGLFVSSITESPVIAAVVGFFSLLFMYLLSTFAAMIPTDALASFICFVLLAAALSLVVYFFTKNSTFAVGLFAVAAIVLSAVYFFSSAVFEGAFPAMLDWLCVYDRFLPFISGMFDLSAVVYYISVIIVCLFLAVQSQEKRRWN